MLAGRKNLLKPPRELAFIEGQPQNSENLRAGATLRSFFFVKYIKFFILLVTLALITILNYFGLLRDDAQTIAFPLLVIAFSLPIRSKYLVHIPALWSVLLLCAWAFSALHIRGYLENQISDSEVFLARLSNDKNGLGAHNLLQKYNDLSKIFSLPKMTLLQRSFATEDEASTWLEKNSNARILISGTPQWLELTLPGVNQSYLSQEQLDHAQIPPEINEEMQKFNIFSTDTIAPISIPGFQFPLLVVTTPAAVALSNKDFELTRNFLGWLAGGITDNYSELKLPPLEKNRTIAALRRVSLIQAAGVRGAWLSSTPLALARLFIGTLDLVEGLNEGLESESFSCAIRNLGSAIGYIKPKYQPELYSALYNNLAITKVFLAHKKNDLKKASIWFWKAIEVSKYSKRNLVSSRVAMVNLLILKRNGIL